MMGKCCDVMHGLKPALMMVLVQATFAGVNIFYKLAANDGMSLKIMVAYRFIFASAFIVPVAFVVERNKRPKMTWMILLQGTLCGLFGGALAQNLYVRSLVLTSTTFASAMANLVPAITFIMAICCRLESLQIKSITGTAKVLGTVLGIGGAMILTFYRGAELNIWSAHVDLLHHKNGHIPPPSSPSSSSSHSDSGHRVLGSLLAVGSCMSYALWLIIQTKLSERYPCHYSGAALMCTTGALLGSLYAFCTEKDWNQWKLGLNIRLLSVSYSGIVASGVMISVIAWCVHLRGPLFVSVFNPLMLVLVAIASSLLLDEKLHVGSIIGAALIVCGLYFVLWGKGKELKKISQLVPTTASNVLTNTDSKSIEIVVDPNQANEDNNVSKGNNRHNIKENKDLIEEDDDDADNNNRN